MKYYAVIDTNVLVSAMLKWNSVPGNVMELAFDGPIPKIRSFMKWFMRKERPTMLIWLPEISSIFRSKRILLLREKCWISYSPKQNLNNTHKGTPPVPKQTCPIQAVYYADMISRILISFSFSRFFIPLKQMRI